MAVGCAGAYAAAVVSSGLATGGVPTSTADFTGGALLLTPGGAGHRGAPAGRPGGPGVLVYLGVVPSALAYGLFLTRVRTVPAAVAAIVPLPLPLPEPLTATVLATALLGERPAPAALAGGCSRSPPWRGCTCGGWEIRTPEGLHPTRFPSERHRPLGESSSCGDQTTGRLPRGQPRLPTRARRVTRS